ncbi:hypothetical protein PPERSA_00116 [Pseudocohnilembus persalinus]|uniref:Uncharacterized protein n=1 Tax=Pseudocohnilembus persalinus TaxID=266149 RepID=A0A0V0Q923_PSEPJ|nr:hypothetical protein PPERSA_00116 [Pseudocohnilembus persalinus]|eukprot:KRW98519.1 hypothetical protein PPERSA_00116 [Pseudocohnilembus persalinus]
MHVQDVSQQQQYQNNNGTILQNSKPQNTITQGGEEQESLQPNENLNTEGNEFLEDSYNQNKQNIIEEQQSEKLYVEEQYNKKFYYTDESNQASSKYKQVDMNQRFQKELEKIKKLGIN